MLCLSVRPSVRLSVVGLLFYHYLWTVVTLLSRDKMQLFYVFGIYCCAVFLLLPTGVSVSLRFFLVLFPKPRSHWEYLVMAVYLLCQCYSSFSKLGIVIYNNIFAFSSITEVNFYPSMVLSCTNSIYWSPNSFYTHIFIFFAPFICLRDYHSQYLQIHLTLSSELNQGCRLTSQV